MFGRQLKATDNTLVEIIDPGVHNTDAGPDFSNARFFHDETLWAGNVEIHIKASDWFRHQHDKDPAYDTVALHVVGVNDAHINRKDGSRILQLCISPPQRFYERYSQLVEKMDRPRCIPHLGEIPDLNRADWLESLGMERLHSKASYIKEILNTTSGDWQQTLFIMLARALGFGLNSVPFELLAKSLPLNYVMRHKDNPEQVEALVFGQASMLDPAVYHHDAYYQLLCREYEFLRRKYNLMPIQAGLWKYSRTRPQNFPHRRLAILAAMLTGGMQFRDVFIEAGGNIDKLTEILDFEASPYWKSHFNFGEETAYPFPVTLSKTARELILINVVAPFYMAYGSILSDPDEAEKGYNLLNDINAERNSMVKEWQGAGLKAPSAFTSQAIIQLTKEYCRRDRCLECRFGHYLLRKTLTVS